MGLFEKKGVPSFLTQGTSGAGLPLGMISQILEGIMGGSVGQTLGQGNPRAEQMAGGLEGLLSKLLPMGEMAQNGQSFGDLNQREQLGMTGKNLIATGALGAGGTTPSQEFNLDDLARNPDKVQTPEQGNAMLDYTARQFGGMMPHIATQAKALMGTPDLQQIITFLKSVM